jgi:hypothetical protein
MTRFLPILPLRDIVVFPQRIVPLFVGREKSVAALEAAMAADKELFLVAQLDPGDDDPDRDALYDLGVIATAMQLLKLPDGTVRVLVEGAKRARLVDLVERDGYMAAERGKCEKDARRLNDLMFATSPYKERRTDFNVWALCPTSLESGISRPSTGIHKRTSLNTTYDAFGSERYVLNFDNKTFRETAQFAPYEVVEIITNTNTYGGGGIFNLYSTVAADSGSAGIALRCAKSRCQWATSIHCPNLNPTPRSTPDSLNPSFSCSATLAWFGRAMPATIVTKPCRRSRSR